MNKYQSLVAWKRAHDLPPRAITALQPLVDESISTLRGLLRTTFTTKV